MNELIDKTTLLEINQHLSQAKRILFITGAGISAESGLPTYRGVSGLYNNQETEDGIRIETALSGGMFRESPEITWKYLSQIEQSCRGKSFNRAHEIIAEMQDHFQEIWVLTQNIDGFHHHAGSKNIIDIHGNVYELSCTRCSYHTSPKDYSEITIPPICPQCNHPVRPDVVLFDEMLPQDKLQQLEQELWNGFDLVFTIGTTSIFPYIAQPVINAAQQGIPTIEINPDATSVSPYVQYKIRSGACVALEEIWSQFQQQS
ncbi:MAG: NAD-dependent protein deacylase [SAR324 cluster bacterium]|uniref:protein acetyllysine N-acetyltransferase n=1 Tax=SAR324 cluster bacterium TaxID=2024889 RepID=A0A2A4T7T2_9DELT|nr:MAG: NAD-dependent protein deacylase [SAR324 cluster bacterium]